MIYDLRKVCDCRKSIPPNKRGTIVDLKNRENRGLSIVFWIVICAIVSAGGCGGKRQSPATKKELISRETELKTRVEQVERENEVLKKQIETLSVLPSGKRAEGVYKVQTIGIGNYTNIYDEDKDGKKETLIVYVSPTDETGDAVKATGEVNIQLWDLSKSGGEAMLGQWTIEPNELKKKWYSSMMSSRYRFTFDVSGVVEDYKAGRPGLTVRVNFVDYLSGRTFSEQKVIKP